ncbi:MAG: AAA family ATPase [Anaerolineae bacterium]
MVRSLADYIPQDRCTALANGAPLPDRAQGAGLFADIVGFTELTEKLTQQLGPRRGIEELTRQINTVYDTIINQMDRYGGSVIGFAGDSMTCWFTTKEAGSLPSESASVRAVSAARAIQAAMAAHPELALKVTVTTGPARRFVVGDPQIQLLDALAGTTVARLATAEHLTHKGEILTDAITLNACPDTPPVAEWRVDPETGERFACLAPTPPLAATGAPGIVSVDIPPETLRPWVLPTVYAREQSGLGEFLTELRPAVALFLRWQGIDYDDDPAAGEKLDQLLRRVQQTLARYDGTVLQLVIGDKGSYLYACVGAPTAHEDDVPRAVRAALALRDLPQALPFLRGVQFGLSRGTLRVGAYGGAGRRTYAAMGDDVNLAARLMMLASPGEILVSGRVRQLLGEGFTLQARPPLPLKGKAEPLPVFAVTGALPRRATRLLEPDYHLPMMGRQAELALVADKLARAQQGQGQVIGITAEAGMGKSRLVAEAIRLAHRQGLTAYGGACESSGTNTAYLVWKPIWQAFFDVDPHAPLRRQLRHLEGELADRAPDRVQTLPLLAPLLDLPIEDNDFTRTLEPKDRRNALEALLEDCLKADARQEPVLLVLEDVHWIDPLSHDLLDTLARATMNLPVCFLLAYRPSDVARLESPRVQALQHYTHIALQELTPADAAGLIRAKLTQLYPERSGRPPLKLVEQILAQAQGNPFFIEELLNYLHDRALDPWGPTGLAVLELPSSLHTLILSRVDQLTEPQQATLKVASIIGRLFPFAWLHGYCPTLGTPAAVKADLHELT